MRNPFGRKQRVAPTRWPINRLEIRSYGWYAGRNQDGFKTPVRSTIEAVVDRKVFFCNRLDRHAFRGFCGDLPEVELRRKSDVSPGRNPFFPRALRRGPAPTADRSPELMPRKLRSAFLYYKISNSRARYGKKQV